MTTVYVTEDAAREITQRCGEPCPGYLLRRLTDRGVVDPIVDSSGRRLWTEYEIDLVGAYLLRRKAANGVAA